MRITLVPQSLTPWAPLQWDMEVLHAAEEGQMEDAHYSHLKEAINIACHASPSENHMISAFFRF